MKATRTVGAAASITAFVIAGLTMLPSASTAAATPPTNTPSASSGLLASSEPKTVVLDPTTGDVVSVTPRSR